MLSNLVFYYKGRDKEGNLVEGFTSAGSVESVSDFLIKKEIVPIDIYVKKSKPFDFLNKKIFIPRVKRMDLIMFCRQMYTMLRAGVPLDRTISLIGDTTESYKLSQALKSVLSDISAGQTLANSMSRFPEVFPNLFINLIEAAESSGQMEACFMQLIHYLELMENTSKQIKTATRYPIFVVSAITVAVFIVTIFVIPNFSQVFARFGVDLPLPTRILIATSRFMVDNWLFMIGFIFVSLFLFAAYKKTERGSYFISYLKLRVPIIGPIIRKILLGRLTRSFSMILKTDVPIDKGIELLSNISDNDYFRSRILIMRDSISRGQTLTSAAVATELFSPLILQLFRTGEESGDIEGLLMEAAEYYEREVDYSLKQLSDSIEPVLLVILGFLVLVLAMGIFLPMWQLAGAIK